MKGWESIGRYPAENCFIDGIPVLRPPTAREDLAIGTMVIGAKVLGADARQVLAASGLKVVYQDDGEMNVWREDWSSPVILNRRSSPVILNGTTGQ